MATRDENDQEWESQAEVDAVLAGLGLSMDQVRRWRRQGLLSKDIDWSPGRAVRYPKRTCAQIRAANALFKRKNRIDYVGLWLWRYGFSVDEKYWRPRLSRIGRAFDRFRKLLPWFIDRFDREFEGPTLYQAAAQWLETVDDIVLSRIKGRLSGDRMPAFLSVMGDVSLGDFGGFGHVVAGEERVSGKEATIRALDVEKAEKHAILGSKLNLIELLPSGLRSLSEAMGAGEFEAVANGPAEGLALACRDARNGLTIGLCLYEANRWVYGDGAFGLRLLAWIARKAPDRFLDGATLLMFRLRQVPGWLMSSEEIAALAQQAQQAWRISKHHEWFWKNDPRFSTLMSPKRIKQAFADPIALKHWQEEVKAASLKPIETNNRGGQ
jgi:hypothetical protein